MSSTTSTYFCVLTIRKHLLKMRFERSGRGQEPSRGHKFSILENVVLHRDFTSATLASFDVILLGRTCPKPCSYSHLAVRKNSVSCLHSSTEELAKRQEVQYTLHSFYFIVTVFLVIKPRAFDTVRALLDTAAIKPCIQAPVSIKFPRI